MKTEIDITTYAPLDLTPMPLGDGYSTFEIDGEQHPVVVGLDETGKNLVIVLPDASKRVIDVVALANYLTDASRNTVPIDELFKRGRELQASLPVMDEASTKRLAELKEQQEAIDEETELIQNLHRNAKQPIQRQIDEVKSEICARLGHHGLTTKFGNARNCGKRTVITYDWKVVDTVADLLDGDRPKLTKLLANARKETTNEGELVITFNEV